MQTAQPSLRQNSIHNCFVIMATFGSVSDKVNFPAEEQNVLAYWNEIDAFKTSLKLSEDKPEYTFYDGPPFATGLPHYG